jgi:hypothetical protein
MQKLIWENVKGERLDLTSAPYGITEWEGFSGIELNVQTQKVPFQDGSVFIDALYEDRTIAVTLAIYDGNNLETRYRLRRELISALNPKAGEGYLIYKNDFIEKRIKAIANNPIFETHNSDMVGTPKASLSWTCCDPYWEDVEETTIKFRGTSKQQIEYDGDVETGLNLEYGGYSAKIGIENLNESKEISINGVGSYKKIDISTQAGKKTVYASELTKEEKYKGLMANWCWKENNCLFFGQIGDSEIPYSFMQIINKTTNEQSVIKKNLNIFSERYNYIFAGKELFYSSFTNKYYIIFTNAEATQSYVYEYSEDFKTENLIADGTVYFDIGEYHFRHKFSVTIQPTYIFKNEDWEVCTDIGIRYFDDLGYAKIDSTGQLWIGEDLDTMTQVAGATGVTSYLFIRFGDYIIAGMPQSYKFIKNGVVVASPLEASDWVDTSANVSDNSYLSVYEIRNSKRTNLRILDKDFNIVRQSNGDGYWTYDILCVDGDLIYYREIYYQLSQTKDFFIIQDINKPQFYFIDKHEGLYLGYAETLKESTGQFFVSNDLKKWEFLFNQNCTLLEQNIGIYNNGVSNIGFEIVNFRPVPLNFSSITGTPNRIRIQNNYIYVCTTDGIFRSSDKKTWTQIYSGNALDISDNGIDIIIITDSGVTINGSSTVIPENIVKVEYSKFYNLYLVQGETNFYVWDLTTFTQILDITGTIVDLKYDEEQSLWWLLTTENCYTYYQDLLSDIEITEGSLLSLSYGGVLVIGLSVQEVKYIRGVNLISNLDSVSDMSLSLKTGTNIISFSGGDKDVLFLKYRKKYIGV